MLTFKTLIKQFGSQGEKTGWTYVEIPAATAAQLKPGCRQSFRVKGKLDAYAFQMAALLPMGEGTFILPLKAEVRKAIQKTKGALVRVSLEVDNGSFEIAADLLECLGDEPAALAFFNKQPGSHQKYFSKWIEEARTPETRTRRIAQTVTAMVKEQDYSAMIRSLKADRDELNSR